MRVVYTKHAAVDKFNKLEEHDFMPKITKKLIEDVIKNPEHEDKISDFPKIIASKTIDEKHVLCVVYKKKTFVYSVGKISGNS